MTLKTTVRCEGCKKLIRNARPNQKHHSETCAKRAQRQRKAQRKTAPKGPLFATMLDAYTALTIRVRQRLHEKPGDVAQRELNRAVDLLVKEMESTLQSRRAKLDSTLGTETAGVSQYISEHDNVIEMMAPKTLAAVERRIERALRDLRVVLKDKMGDGVALAEAEEAFDSTLLKNYEPCVKAEDLAAFVARCEELFAATGWDFDQTSLVANLVLEELDARDSVAQAIEGSLNSFALKCQALRKLRLEKALGLDAATVERLQGFNSPEAGLLMGFALELEARLPEQLEVERREEEELMATVQARIAKQYLAEAPTLDEVDLEEADLGIEAVLRDADNPF